MGCTRDTMGRAEPGVQGYLLLTEHLWRGWCSLKTWPSQVLLFHSESPDTLESRTVVLHDRTASLITHRPRLSPPSRQIASSSTSSTTGRPRVVLSRLTCLDVSKLTLSSPLVSGSTSDVSSTFRLAASAALWILRCMISSRYMSCFRISYAKHVRYSYFVTVWL